MVYKYALSVLVQRLQPFHSLARSQSGSHTHIRSAVTAYESPTVLLEVEMLVTEDLQKGIATTFRPVRVMITLNHIVRKFQSIHHALGQCYFLIGSEIRDITSEKHKVQRILMVYISETSLQVIDSSGIRSKMSISHKSKT